MTVQHMASTLAPAVTVDVVRDVQGFRALEQDWRDLHAASPAATPFQSWDWLFSWWEVYGRRGALRLLTARDADRLVGVLPLMLEGRHILRLVGTGLSDHLDALIHPDCADAVIAAWIPRLLRTQRVHLLDLHEVRPEAALWPLYRRWPGLKASQQQSVCAEFDIAPLEELLAKWSTNTRKAARTAINRTTKNGYRHAHATPENIGDLADQLVAMHVEAWEGRAITPAHLEPEFGRFVHTVCERLALHDGVELVYLDAPEDAKEPLQLFNLMLVGTQYLGGWLSGYNDALRRRVRITALENTQAVEVALRRGVPVMSMLRGLEDGKEIISDRSKVNHRLLLARRGPAATATWLGVLAPVAAKARLRQWEQQSGTGAQVATFLRTARDRFSR